MKRTALSRDLVPVKELRANLASCIGALEEDGRPVVITQRGKAAAVLLHPAALDRLEDEKELVEKVLRGLRELQAETLLDDEAVWADIDAVLSEGGGSDEDHVDTRRSE